MRRAPWIIVFALDSPGSVEWFGSLVELCRSNDFCADERRDQYAAFRSGEGWTVGGGAAPAYKVAVYDADEGERLAA